MLLERRRKWFGNINLSDLRSTQLATENSTLKKKVGGRELWELLNMAITL